MDKRSLLGGAKRQQRARDHEEAERWWEQDTGTPTTPEPARDTAESPEPSAEPGPPSNTEEAAAPDLPWLPAGGAETGAPQQRAIPWKLDMKAGSPPQQESIVSGRPGEAPGAVTARQDQRTASAEELGTFARGQARNRVLARWGWAALAATLVVTIAVSLL